MWRTIRISLLLLTLVAVGFSAWFDQHHTTSWQHSVWVGVFPVNADGSRAAARYIDDLREPDFAPLVEFIAREAPRYGVSIAAPVSVRLYAPLRAAPPLLEPTAGALTRVLWSLNLRRFRWQTLHSITRSRPQIALFVLYHDPARTAVLPHSLGLQRGLMGVVHVFAAHSQHDQNAVVIAHELLHTFGATDKYSAADDSPLFPAGYAEPERQPRYPQRYAELMAGRIPLSPTTQVMPDDLSQVRVGPASAREIGWRMR